MGKKGAINSLYQAINMDPQFYFIFLKKYSWLEQKKLSVFDFNVSSNNNI